MNINRDNYEEYFLLYADNELTDSEKVEVIMFLKNNKDLEEEFRMIHHTISKPEIHVQLTDKSFLFKTDTSSFINEKNYEEVFVLYHDNELSEKEKLETEEFLLARKELKHEFDLIGLARLAPENSIIFPNRKILYRKEKPGKVIPLIFRRIIAAAVFIGFGLWIANFYLQKNSGVSDKIVHSDFKTNSSPKNEIKKIDTKKTTEIVAQSPGNINQSSIKDSIDKKRLTVSVIKQNKRSFYKNNDVAKTIVKSQKLTKEGISNSLPVKTTEAIIASDEKIKNLPANEISTDNNIEPLKDVARNTFQNSNDIAQPDTYAKTASYVTDADNKNQNYVFYDVTTTQFKKTKVAGFLKKVKRVIERNNPIARLLSGDDRQVVSK